MEGQILISKEKTKRPHTLLQTVILLLLLLLLLLYHHNNYYMCNKLTGSLAVKSVP
jgi:hypothetical protein